MSKLDVTTLKPGDVVIVEMGVPFVRWLVWLQAILTGRAKYRKNGHVIVVSHRDEEGRLWGIEAQAKGIGWTLMDKRHGKYGISNAEQPKSDEDRHVIVETMKNLLGTSYDYLAYVDIALQTLGITRQWTDFQGNDVPVHFICSAVADYDYEERGLPNPGGFKVTRYTTPAEWAEFIDKKQWEQQSA